MPRSFLIGDVGGLKCDMTLLSTLFLPLLTEAIEEAEADRCLGSARHSSRLTLASGIEGAAEASKISVNLEVVIVNLLWGCAGRQKWMLEIGYILYTSNSIVE